MDVRACHPGRKQSANEWLLTQKSALDRHDAEEGVPGAVAPPRKEIILGVGVGALLVLAAWLSRVLHH